MKCTILKKNDDGDLIFYLCNFTVGYYITIKNKHLLCVTVHLHSCFVRDLLAKVDLIVYFVIFPARSIASKGKSDVKESTDSSTTLEDDDKGNLFALPVMYNNHFDLDLIFESLTCLAQTLTSIIFAALFKQIFAFW